MHSDLKFALRMLLKSPAFTTVALLTLALGIGANVAIFSLIDATLLRPLPVAHPEQLALLTDPTDAGASYGTTNGTRGLLAYTEYTALRDENQVFSGLLAVESESDSAQIDWSLPGTAAAAEPAQTDLVSANYFDVLGLSAYRGRTFAANEGVKEGADPVAVMSYAYWNQRFHRDPAVLGRTFRDHGHAFTVIGVAAPGFVGENVGEATDLWIPITMQAAASPGMDMLHDPPGVSRVMWLQVIGRRKPGISLKQAEAATNVIFLRLVQQQAGAATDAQTRQNIASQKLALTSGAQGTSGLRGEFRLPLLALFALVGLVLLLAAINLASLLLARAAARQKEMGVRIALGAGRARVLRQLLTESLLLSTLGGLLGALLAVGGERLLLRMVGGDGGIHLSLTPDWRVLAFVAGLCVATGIAFGLVPAMRMSRLDLNYTLQAQGRGGSARGQKWWGGWPVSKVLVVGQVALSIVLLMGAALFVRSLQNLQEVRLGFRADHLLEFQIDPGAAGYRDQAALTFFRSVLERTATLPGVQGVAIAQDGLFAHNEGGLPIAVDGYLPPNGHKASGARFDQVSADYFATTGIPILRGRALNEADESGGIKNAVINLTMAKQFFANRNPLGMQLHDTYPDDHGVSYTVVGICADAKYNHLDEKTPPRFYLPFFNGVPGDGPSGGSILMRATGGSGTVGGQLRGILRDLDPNVQVPAIHTVAEMVSESEASPKMLAKLSGFFGGLALLLAAIGLYGVMSYGVARRTAEIGVRMALGAGQGAVLGMILGETGLLLAIGLLLGIPASIGAAKLTANQISLFQLQYYDPAALAWAALSLSAVAALAGWLPAHRASRVDPLAALRVE